MWVFACGFVRKYFLNDKNISLLVTMVIKFDEKGLNPTQMYFCLYMVYNCYIY